MDYNEHMKTKAVIFGNNPKEAEEIVRNAGFDIVKEAKDKPDVIITFGGDGTIVLSEFHFPGIPKLTLKSSRVCNLCEPYENEDVLKKYMQGKYTVKKIHKIEATVNGKTLHAMNEIILHNIDPRRAIRYHMKINGEQIPKHEIIGDGAIISNPFGSTGYYRSITGSVFKVGMGVAFNNSTEQSDHMVLDEKDVVTISITRGPGLLYADNQEDSIHVNDGDEIVVHMSKNAAHLVRVTP
jgi:NAD+ kinase